MVEGVGVRLNRPDLPVGGLEFSDQAHRLLMVILQKLCSSHTTLPRTPPGTHRLGARSLGERRIDRNDASPKSPRLRSAIIACAPAHPAPTAPRDSNGSSAHARTLPSDAYPGRFLLTYRSATTMPDGARGGSSRRSRCMECNLIALKQCMTYV